ncbi:MAG: flagellar hook assembly protein FlgD [Sulfuricella sp.]|nr:flagellar hook assembly protein FlgD [Sulfuricella sp.]
MSVTVDTSSVTGTAASGTSTAKKADAQSTEDRFLQLLVAQMKNQDPLNPLDNAQVTSQMAQLSTVTGIEKLNTALQSMSSSFTSSQSLQAAGMIGRSILAPGSSLSLQNGTSAGGFALSQPVDQAVVTIKDAAGNVLESMNIGAQKAGNVLFQWDGSTSSGTAAPNGTYKFEVSTLQDGKKVDVTADNLLSLGTVGSVSLNASGVTLNTDLLGSVNITNVKQIF